MLTDRREDMLVRVASLYYERDYNQQQIADLLKLSRSNISRMLKEAKARGLVEIRIRKRIPTEVTLEQRLIDQFNLGEALVLNGGDTSDEERLALLGELAARHVEAVLQPHHTLAISWGNGVNAVVQAMDANPELGVDVAQLIGSVGSVVSVIDGPELARQLAEKLGGNYYYLAAPLFADSEAARDMFMRQTTIIRTLDAARRASVALVGIGTTDPGASSFLRAGHLTETQVTALRTKGAVGESSGYHFDIHGNPTALDINRRVIGLLPDEVKRIPHVIAVACGAHKVRAILGALRGSYLNTLVTDDFTATAVLDAAD